MEAPAGALPDEHSPCESVVLPDGLFCVVIGLEDLLIDRLNVWKHWNSRVDGEMAELLVRRFAADLDWPIWWTKRSGRKMIFWRNCGSCGGWLMKIKREGLFREESIAETLRWRELRGGRRYVKAAPRDPEKRDLLIRLALATMVCREQHDYLVEGYRRRRVLLSRELAAGQAHDPTDSDPE